jgi:hypothetical protein
MRHAARLVRSTLAVLLLLVSLAPAASLNRAVARDAPIEIDLAAITLTTADLEEAGLEGYGVGGSRVRNAERFAAYRFFSAGDSYPETQEMLDDTGFVRSNEVWMFSPQDDESISQTISSMVTLFEDADGAEEAFDILEDESNDDTAEDIDGFDDVGDRSEATYYVVEDSHDRLTASAIVDNLIVSVSIFDWFNEEVDEELVAELFEVAIDRIEDGLDAETPALSNLVLRFGDSIETTNDFYLLRNGEMSLLYGEEEADREWRIEYRENLGIIEHYQLIAGMVDFDSDISEPAIFQYVDIFRFEDEDAAEEWIDGREDAIDEGGFYESFEVESSRLGDNAFFYEAVGLEGSLPAYSFAVVQIGEIGIEFGFGGPFSTLDALESIAEEQVECIEDGGCFDFIPLTDELLDLISEAATTESDDEDDNDQDEDESDDPEPPDDADNGDDRTDHDDRSD